MDNLDEFKAFLKTIPSIKEDVLNHRYTWQQIYEIYTMYGENDHFFDPYKNHSVDFRNYKECGLKCPFIFLTINRKSIRGCK
jgi:hypothetical protein